MNITAQLECVAKVAPTSTSRMPRKITLPIAKILPHQYQVSYKAIERGLHKLHVQVDNGEISRSFNVIVYPDPTRLGQPVKIIKTSFPFGIAFNNHGEMIVSERFDHRVSIYDIRGEMIQTFGSHGENPDQMILPRGVATDDFDNIYVSSDHKLQKFTKNGKLIKHIGKEGKKEGEFDNPKGIALFSNQVFVCDGHNQRIQVFDLDFNFIRSLGSYGKGVGEFDGPYDVKIDNDGNIYVAEANNKRVQVLDSSGQFIRAFGEEELKGPSGLCIADKYIYVSDLQGHCIVVYELSGQFVTSFGKLGSNVGELRYPFHITSDCNGFIHVCDWSNARVQVF